MLAPEPRICQAARFHALKRCLLSARCAGGLVLGSGRQQAATPDQSPGPAWRPRTAQRGRF